MLGTKPFAALISLFLSVVTSPTIVQAQARGLAIPRNVSQRFDVQRLFAEKYMSVSARLGAVSRPQALCSFTQAKFDLRSVGLMTPAKDQGPICNSCWAFAAASAIESSYAYFSGLAQQTLERSEQELLECSKTVRIPSEQKEQQLYNCTNGGFFDGPFNYAEVVNRGVLGEADYVTANREHGYQARDGACVENQVGRRIRVGTWNSIADNRYGIASTENIKKSLCAHGGVATGIDTYKWQGYGFTGDIIIGEKTVGPSLEFHTVTVKGIEVSTAHAVQIVGWDDSEPWTSADGESGKGVWLIKNSWGGAWANRGVVKIPYDRQLVGAYAVWVAANVDAATRSLPDRSQSQLLNVLEQIRASKIEASEIETRGIDDVRQSLGRIQ